MPGRESSLGFVFPKFPIEVIEYPQSIAVQISGRELAQVPGLVFRFGDELRPGLPPAMVQFVDFLLAVEVQPEHDWSRIAIALAEGGVCKKQATVGLRDASDAVLIVVPVEMET